MKLEKLILVNWGSLRAGEYPMGNLTLLTGPTGSGKSTMLDALQTVMTAAYQNIFSYNPGQDETTQTARNGKTKRTLWSYIVGAEDNLFARPNGAHGYVAAVFRPDGSEGGETFTALISAAAHVEGSGSRRQAVQERLALIIVDDAALTLEDLLTVQAEALQVVEVERIETHLKSKYRKVSNFRDTKKEYLCQLYGRFRGQRTVSFAEAELAARAWSQAIAHKPIGSVDELVKTQILEYDPQQLAPRISQISDLMRQVRRLRVEGERLAVNISRLEAINGHVEVATKAYETAVQYQVAQARRSLLDDERQIAGARKEKARLTGLIDKESLAIEEWGHAKQGLSDSQVSLEAKLQGIPAADQKSRIDDKLGQARADSEKAIAALMADLGQATLLQQRANAIAGMAFPPEQMALEEVAGRLTAVKSKIQGIPLSALTTKLQHLSGTANFDHRLALDAADELKGLPGLYDELYQVLTNAETGFAAVVNDQLGAQRQAVRDAGEKEQDLAARKKRLAGGESDYPREITAALDRFRSDLPAAQVKVLCDLIEPKDRDWQPAIEGYLGKARFNFVVDTEWEAKAIELVRNFHLKAKVIQGSLCLKHAKPALVPASSIIHDLHTEHPVARAYLVEQYGTVVKVDSTEELRHTPRGLMRDGKASGSRAMFTADAVSLVFGKEAQRRGREVAIREHEAAERELNRLKQQQTELRGLLALVDGLRLPGFGSLAGLKSAAVATESALADLGRLDLTEVDKLEHEKEALRLQIKALDDLITAANQRIGDHKRAIQEQSRSERERENGLENKRQAVDLETRRMLNLVLVNPALSGTELEENVAAIVDGRSAQHSQLQKLIPEQRELAIDAAGDVREAVAEYNHQAHSEERLILVHDADHRGDFSPVYGALVQLGQRIHEQLVSQREIGLVSNLDQLRQAEASFNDVFTRQFCYEVRNAVDNGVKTLRVLNTELGKLKFGTDRFSIDWSEWVPEFKDYYDFFSAAYDLAEAQESGDLFGTDALSPENCRVRDRLQELLLSDEQDRALRDLQRIADYRNYRRYEIWKESDSGSKVALSEWGTGSGGQLETPAYIVRAAVVTNRLKHFDKGMNLKLLVNDESFAKMDERRAHDVIKFIRDSLGMQLICAMPTKHAGAIKSEFSKEWCFTRTQAEGNGEVDFVSEADERDLNPDKLRELWAERRSQVRQQAQLAFEAAEQTPA
jgi:energy-coupling factor transporter ATP-binding protein EcfA2